MVMLSQQRVLDLSDHWGSYCGVFLAELGFEVIKVEKPGGDPLRWYGPYWQDDINPEKSLVWFAFNRGKKGITLRLDSPRGKNIFAELTRKIDFVIESSPPGAMQKLGLNYERLSKIDPKIILVSITPFGQTGPYSDYKASDIVIQALGGTMYSVGDEGRPPVRISMPLSYIRGGMHGAVGALTALYYRERSMEGQHVDVSVHEDAARVLCFELPCWEYEKQITPRLGVKRVRGNVQQGVVWPCKDGYVAWSLMGGVGAAKGVRAMLDWMKYEGKAGLLSGIEVGPRGLDLAAMSQQDCDIWDKIAGEFFLSHTKRELFEMAREHDMYICSVNTVEEVLGDEHLEGRGFWYPLHHDNLGETVTYCGPFYRSTEQTPSTRLRAPLIGEHNHEIYTGVLGLSQQEVTSLRNDGII